MNAAKWKTLPFESAVQSRGSGSTGLPTKEWLPQGHFPVIGQGAEDIEGWTDREDLLLTPTPAVVLYGGHTRRAKHVSQPFVPGPNVKILRPIPTVDSKFLYYFLTQLPVENKGYADHFPLVRKCDVPVPPMAEQQRIVGVLDEAFVGIAAAKVHAERNLQNARALFDSHLQAVFTQRGDGWVEKTVGELVEDGMLAKPFDGNHGEIHPRKADYTASGVPFIMACDLKDGEVDTEQCTFISRKLADSLRVGFAKNGDVLISHKGTIGRTAIVNTTHEYIMLTPQVTAYRVMDSRKLDNRFIRSYFMSPLFQREMIAGAADGSTRAYIGITKQRGLRLRFPAILEQRRIAAGIAALDSETQRLASLYQRKLATLDELKKSLLYRAFRGEL